MMEGLLCSLICLLLGIVPISLLWLWIRTVRQLWRDGKTWKKVIAISALALCVAGTVAACVCVCQLWLAAMPPVYTLMLPAYYIFAFLMFALNGILMKRRWKYWLLLVPSTIICTIVTLFLVSFTTLFQNFSLSKQDVSFKDKKDIEERLELNDFPTCSFDKAYYSEYDDGNIRVVFKYEGVDSIAVTRFIERLKREHPMLCEVETEDDVLLKYGTLYINHDEKDTTYVNIRFFKNYHDGFVIAYGGVYNAPNLQTMLKNSLECAVPKCELLSYEIHRFGPDYGWEGLYSFERPLSKTDIRRLKQVCGNKGWNFSENDGKTVLHYLEEGEYSWDITLVKGKGSSYSTAKVEFNTY